MSNFLDAIAGLRRAQAAAAADHPPLAPDENDHARLAGLSFRAGAAVVDAVTGATAHVVSTAFADVVRAPADGRET